MFDIFRQEVRYLLKKQKLNYFQLGEMTHLTESTIKSFMCGANDSRRVAEKIADAFSEDLLYSNGEYKFSECVRGGSKK